MPEPDAESSLAAAGSDETPLDSQLVEQVTAKVREILARGAAPSAGVAVSLPEVSIRVGDDLTGSASSPSWPILHPPANPNWLMESRLDDSDHALIALLAGRRPPVAARLSTEASARLAALLLRCWQVLPGLPLDVLDDTLSNLLSGPDLRRVRDGWCALGAFARAQLAVAGEFLDALALDDVPYALLKGSAIALTVHEHPQERTGWDLDIGVAKADLPRAERAALTVGYHQAQQDPSTGHFQLSNPGLRASVEAAHYELGFIAKRLVVTGLDDATRAAITAYSQAASGHWLEVDRDDPCCYATIDVHHAISLDIPIDELLHSARAVDVAGRSVWVANDAWLVFHLIFKIYWEGVHAYGKGLYQYADLVRLIPRLDESGWSELIAALKRHRLEAGAFYVLRRLAAFGVVLPEHARTFVAESGRPQRGTPDADNDLGDMWPKLWGGR